MGLLLLHPNLGNGILKVLMDMSPALGLKKLFYQFIDGMRDEIPRVIDHDNLGEIDTILNFNSMFLKDSDLQGMDQAEKVLGAQYLRDIPAGERRESIRSQLRQGAEAAKEHLTITPAIEKKALRTLRDTIYRLQKDGALPASFEKDGIEVLYRHEHRVKIFLEKRMAFNRVSQKRNVIFQLSTRELEKLLTTHPKDFLPEIEKRIEQLTVTPVVTEDKTLGDGEEAGNKEALKVTEPKEREKRLRQLCSDEFGLEIDEQTSLMIKLLALR